MSTNTLGRRTYTVKKSDTLWGIAKSEYGDGQLWASIAKENNLPSPDVLFVGQNLALSQKPITARSNSPISPLIRQAGAKTIVFPTYEFEFSRSEETPPIYVGPVKVTIKLEGKLNIQKKGVLLNFKAKDLKQIEVKSKQEIGNTFQTLVSETKFVFDPEKKTLKPGGGLASVLKLPGGGEIKNEMKWEGKKITFAAKLTKVQGVYKDLAIEGTFGYEISFECEDFLNVAPARVWLPSVRIDWNEVVVITLVGVGIVAGLVLVAKILPYVLTAAAVTAILAIPFLTAWQMLNKTVPIAGSRML